MWLRFFYVCTSLSIHVCVCVCVYIYMYIYTHTHTHIQGDQKVSVNLMITVQKHVKII
jgi:hypothetical protein